MWLIHCEPMHLVTGGAVGDHWGDEPGPLSVTRCENVRKDRKMNIHITHPKNLSQAKCPAPSFRGQSLPRYFRASNREEKGAKRKAAVKERKEGQLERTASGIRHVVPCKAELHQSGLSSPSVPFAK